jgi:hypothetical protein
LPPSRPEKRVPTSAAPRFKPYFEQSFNTAAAALSPIIFIDIKGYFDREKMSSIDNRDVAQRQSAGLLIIHSIRLFSPESRRAKESKQWDGSIGKTAGALS